MSRACAAEAVGTFFLVITIISAAIAATLDKPIAGPPSAHSLSRSPEGSPWQPPLQA
jgi:glycerol uptake facilitator-like aquaporin